MTARQKLLVCVLLGLILAGTVVMTITVDGFVGGAVISLLLLLLFCLRCLPLFRADR
jgi:hypothetical protein